MLVQSLTETTRIDREGFGYASIHLEKEITGKTEKKEYDPLVSRHGETVYRL
jgi:hypothetical protein